MTGYPGLWKVQLYTPFDIYPKGQVLLPMSSEHGKNATKPWFRIVGGFGNPIGLGHDFFHVVDDRGHETQFLSENIDGDRLAGGWALLGLKNIKFRAELLHPFDRTLESPVVLRLLTIENTECELVI